MVQNSTSVLHFALAMDGFQSFKIETIVIDKNDKFYEYSYLLQYLIWYSTFFKSMISYLNGCLSSTSDSLHSKSGPMEYVNVSIISSSFAYFP